MDRFVKKRIITDISDGCVRSALAEDDRLVEFLIDSAGSGSVAGNIYAGIVKAVLPNQFAFVEIGLPKNAFLNLADRREDKIAKKIKQGEEILVQVLRDPSGDKGAYVTSELSVSGRFAVLINSGAEERVNVSKKITSSAERKKLIALIEKILPPGVTAIARTESQNATDEAITDEINGLAGILSEIVKTGPYKRAPALVRGENSVAARQLGELYANDINEIMIGGEFNDAPPAIPRDKIIFYRGEEPVFDRYFLTGQINKIYERKVWLKSGGFIIIDRTESCFVIDVNTGKYRGKSGHGESVMKVNLEAADEAAFQMRLRNLSGIIIIDFIGLKNAADKALVHERLKKAVSKDRIPATILDSNALGLFILTRKKIRKPYAHEIHS